MFNDSIIKKTNQWWKAIISFLGLMSGGAIMFIGLANLNNKELVILLVSAGIVVGMVSSVFACTAIRCPICKAPWVWLAFNGKSPNEWLTWLLNQSQCPKCNSTDVNKST